MAWKYMANSKRTIVSQDSDQVTEVIHSPNDPGMWIVRRWEKVFLHRKLVFSCWFNDKRQALDFAAELARK